MTPFDFSAVLFDLDGTLLDTAPDLGRAANHVLASIGKAPLSADIIATTASDGAMALIKAGLSAAEQNRDDLADLRAEFLAYYANHLYCATRLFPGIADVIRSLEHRNMPWGIVTNKPAFLTEPLIAQIPEFRHCGIAVSADTLPVRKPHPDPLWYACDHLGCPADQTLYVGDHVRDIQAGKNAGMQTMIAGWGYIKPTESLPDWQADYIFNTPHDVFHWMNPIR